jgi:hypothetical protein
VEEEIMAVNYVKTYHLDHFRPLTITKRNILFRKKEKRRSKTRNKRKENK